ncbi:hypothetical protein ACS0TY_002037 [Phlomoides rotata]
MASSNVIASRSPSNSDLPRQSSTSSLNLHSDQSRGFSMNMDEILRNIYADPASFAIESNGGGGDDRGGGGLAAVDGGMRHVNDIKSADEVWRDIVSGGAGIGGSGGEPGMTLEDFLAKAGAVNEEDVRVTAVVTMPPPPPPPPTVGAFGIETVMMNPVAGVPAAQFTPAGCVQNVLGVDFGGGMPAASGGGRGKRRVAVEEPPLDKATQQKQRRMIKNRESAARSRERKQAYTVELEALVTQLEEDNARLVKEEVWLF